MFWAIFLYRIGNFFYRKKLKGVGQFISIIIRYTCSCWLPSSASIGKNFKLGYGGLGIVIHNNAEIGDNVTIAQNVTIGRNFGDTKVPKIGNDVYIGTGSVIFGEIEIGDNVIIGSNSVINKNVSANTTVVGNPMRVIKENRIIKYYEMN